MGREPLYFAEGEYYHLLNRGNNKKDIFLSEYDYARFLLYILYFQSPVPLHNISQHVKRFVEMEDFGVGEEKVNDILADRYVELVAFALMPNHFHLLVRELKENGIVRYIHRCESGLAHFWRAKYKHSGHFFEGPYKAVRVENNTQLLHLSAYQHKNPQELSSVGRRGIKIYLWSSYRDYLGENRWGELLRPGIILDQFSSAEEYRDFVRASIAKERLDNNLHID